MSNHQKEQRGSPHSLENLPSTWQTAHLAHLVEEMADGGTPSRQGSNEYFGGEINWAVVEDVKYEIEDTKEKLTDRGLKNSSATLWPAGSVIVTTGATIGKVGLAVQPTATKQGITGIIPGPHIHAHYLARFLESNRSLLTSWAQGTTFKEIRPYLLGKVEVAVPPLDEQRKIASVLYTVDQLIEQTAAIIYRLQRAQKALLYNLFGRERTSPFAREFGAKTIRLGPKLFQVPSDWKTVAIRDVGEVVTGDTPATDDESNYGGDLPFITPEDFGGSRYVSGGRRYLSSEGEAHSRPVPRDSVLVECIGKVGRVRMAGRRLATNQQINAIVVEREMVVPEFLYYQIRVLADILRATAGQTTVPIISKGIFSATEVLMPPRETQLEIVTALSAFDDKVEVNRQYQQSLRRMKKGLMQDLLSGEVRTHDKGVEVIDEVGAYG